MEKEEEEEEEAVSAVTTFLLVLLVLFEFGKQLVLFPARDLCFSHHVSYTA